MSWKKKNKEQKKDELNVRLTVIPDIFYGGADPLIYHEQKAKSKEQEVTGKKKPAKKEEKKEKHVPIFSKKKVIVIAVVFSLFAVSGISWYYINQDFGKKQNGPEKIVKQEPEPKPKPEPEPKPEPKPEPVPEPEPIPKPEPRPLEFPRILLNDSPDIDVDSLTDVEEELFKTDSGVWDTDDDGYYDGQEIFNLYNPTGFAPVKLIDSGLVKEYSNPTYKYRIYYPIGWEVGNVDDMGDHVLFSSITGDFVEVRAIEKLSTDSFSSWFAKNISGQKFSNLTSISNRFSVNGYKRNDSLVAYFMDDNNVFVIIYQPAGDAENIPFRHAMQMMYQSFRTSGASSVFPSQVVLPQPTTNQTEESPELTVEEDDLISDF